MAEVDAITIEVPNIGDASDVDITEIHVSAGDEVAESDPLITLESEKSSNDVPAPCAGTVKEVLVSVGGKASEGTGILTLVPADGASAPAASEQDDAVAPAAEAAESGDDEQQAVDAAVDETAPGDEDAAAADREKSTPPSPRSGGAPAGQPPITPTEPERTPDGIDASPSARRRARELGIDLGSVAGSARGGRITYEDVERAAAAPVRRGVAPGGEELDLLPWPEVDFTRYGEVERVSLSKIRRLTRDNLWRNWVRIPHVTQHDEADITELEAFRKRLNAEQGDVKVTLVALLMKACVATLKAFPNVNSSLDGDELVLKRYYHLGFAADTPKGLLVPVIRDVDRKGILELAAELTELSGKARAGTLSPGDMQGATFTISSLGGIGGTAFTPIINAPEVAILGVVRAATKPVWDGEQFQPRLMLPLSLSYDHRVIDGAEAARFVVHLASVLTDLKRVLL